MLANYLYISIAFSVTLLSQSVSAWVTKPIEPVFSVKDHGCQGTLDLLEKAGGGTFLVPEGILLCPALNVTSNIVFYLEEGAILKADWKTDWPTYEPLPNYMVSHDHPTPGALRYAPFIGGFGTDNFIIGGENGTID